MGDTDLDLQKKYVLSLTRNVLAEELRLEPDKSNFYELRFKKRLCRNLQVYNLLYDHCKQIGEFRAHEIFIDFQTLTRCFYTFDRLDGYLSTTIIQSYFKNVLNSQNKTFIKQ